MATTEQITYLRQHAAWGLAEALVNKERGFEAANKIGWYWTDLANVMLEDETLLASVDAIVQPKIDDHETEFGPLTEVDVDFLVDDGFGYRLAEWFPIDDLTQDQKSKIMEIYQDFERTRVY